MSLQKKNGRAHVVRVCHSTRNHSINHWIKPRGKYYKNAITPIISSKSGEKDITDVHSPTWIQKIRSRELHISKIISWTIKHFYRIRATTTTTTKRQSFVLPPDLKIMFEWPDPTVRHSLNDNISYHGQYWIKKHTATPEARNFPEFC